MHVEPLFLEMNFCIQIIYTNTKSKILTSLDVRNGVRVGQALRRRVGRPQEAAATKGTGASRGVHFVPLERTPSD
jgi:hypothetical protein